MRSPLPEPGFGEDRGSADHERWATRLAAHEAEEATLAELLSRAAEGDICAFAALYDRTCARRYGVALRVLRDPGFAEDTTQEVYLQIWRTARRFDSARGSPLAWLTTLAHRRAVDRVRVEQAQTERVIGYDVGNRSREFDEVVDEVLDRVERRSVHEGLALLTDRQRESIALAYFGGMTYREVADHLCVALPTIKSRIRGGLIRLRGSVDTA